MAPRQEGPLALIITIIAQTIVAARAASNLRTHVGEFDLGAAQPEIDRVDQGPNEQFP
jgi:hypothetical protein